MHLNHRRRISTRHLRFGGPFHLFGHEFGPISGAMVCARLCLRHRSGMGLCRLSPAQGELWAPSRRPCDSEQLDDLLFSPACRGSLSADASGYILPYLHPSHHRAPGEILQIWNGGMSFHGGFVGVVGICNLALLRVAQV